jgi:3-methylfumaryl-CoA hydratase
LAPTDIRLGAISCRRSTRNVGSPCKRTSRIVDISRKEGRQGALWLVELEHLVEVEGRRVLSERQTLAYTDAPPARERAPESGFDSSCWPNVRMVDTDPVLLFRYSALTFNAHRIHYDLPYATQEEGYPGLVVQGPLIATLLLNFCSELLQGPVERFAFRSVSPALCGAALQLLAREADGRLEMMAVDEDGRQLTKATAHGQPPAGGRAIQNEGQLQW